MPRPSDAQDRPEAIAGGTGALEPVAKDPRAALGQRIEQAEQAAARREKEYQLGELSRRVEQEVRDLEAEVSAAAYAYVSLRRRLSEQVAT